MTALTLIKRHIDKITKPEVYIEESLYTHIHALAKAIHSQMRFEEQNLVFDFNTLSY